MSQRNRDHANETVETALLRSPQLRMIGPHRGGRVVAVAGDVSDPMTFYFGACAGGVWKTTDGGRFWRNVSDGYFTTAAVGAIAVSESDPNVIYAGTGEACIRGNVSHGDGVYKSMDGGRSWANMGLRDTRHIGKIQIHPDNPDLVYVAALGHAWGPNAERGVFRSEDGGESWQKVLYKSPNAGSHDVSLDPNNPRILFAAIWQAQRYPHALINGGPESGLWHSFDGGDTWEDITRRSNLPQGVLGKLGVVVSPAREGRVWTVIEAEDGAVFRSDDYGETWIRLSEQSLLRTRPWYYMHITADTQDPDTVYVQNYSFWKSIDAGATFTRIPTPHGDEHALWIDPDDNQRMIEGNDGGACVSFNGGRSWSSIYNQPTAQLYHVTTDNRVPYRVYGSQQDNTALSIPSRSTEGPIHEREWYAPGGGESGYIAVKPDDPNIIVASGPAGRRAYNDIMTTYDRLTGQKWNTTVWPELYGWGVGAESLKYRFQWTFPIHFSQHDPNVLHVASNHVHRSTDLGASFDVVSPDLTRADPETLGPSGGPVTRDNTGAEVYATIFALAESPHERGVFWAGSDDGLIYLTRDDMQTWRNVTPTADLLPDWPLISIIEPSPHDPATVYVAATRYKHDDTHPYLLKTSDYGQTWTRIDSDLPSDDFTRVIREDPNRKGLLYAGTETGLYVSFDDGGHWRLFPSNLPVVPIHDVVVKGVELVVATHGRSFWILDDLTPLYQLQDAAAAGGDYLFQPRPTMRMRVYGRPPGEVAPGHVHYTRADTSNVAYLPVHRPDGSVGNEQLEAGANPPQGVVIQYYVENAPAGGVTLAILDDAGRELRRMTSAADGVSAAPGMNRFVWNMRLPGAPKVEGEDLEPWHRTDGPMVLPGSYRMRLEVNGRAQEQSFQIEPDPRQRSIPMGSTDLQAQFAFLQEILGALSTVNRTVNRTGALLAQARAWQQRARELDAAAVGEAAGELERELLAIRPQLIDVNMRQSQLWPSGLHEKLNALFDSVDSADYAPPRQARDVFAQLSGQLAELTRRLDTAVAERATALNRAIAAAGIPVVGVPD